MESASNETVLMDNKVGSKRANKESSTTSCYRRHKVMENILVHVLKDHGTLMRKMATLNFKFCSYYGTRCKSSKTDWTVTLSCKLLLYDVTKSSYVMFTIQCLSIKETSNMIDKHYTRDHRKYFSQKRIIISK